MTRRHRRRSRPGWAIAKDALLSAFASSEKTCTKIGRVRFLGEGLYHRAYLAACAIGDETMNAVVRLPSTRAPDQEHTVERVNREVAVLRYLANHSFPLRIPRMIATVPIGNALAIIQTAVDGFPVEMRAARSRLISPWDAVAEAAASCHHFDGGELHGIVPTFPTYRDHAVHELAVVEHLDIPNVDAIRVWVQEHLPDEEPSGLIHGDLLGQNLLISLDEEPALGVIDWHCAAIGDPAYDLAIATRGARRPFQTASGMTRLLDAYASRTGVRLARAHIGLYELALKAQAYLYIEQDPRCSRAYAQDQRNTLSSFARFLMSEDGR